MSFDLLAPHYRWMEFVLAGEKLQRCRVAFLDEISAAANILLLGEGHGRCLIECCRRFPNARITCVDASERMLAEASRRLMRSGRKTDRAAFIHADILNWAPPVESYDLIVTQFFLDCFPADQLGRVVSRLAAAATPQANWLLADFQMPAHGLRRVRGRLILWLMYVWFRAVTRLPARKLTPPDSFLESAEFKLHRRIETEWGLLHSDWWMKNRNAA